jgi:Spy/CpxP family protein refolding chaperone
MTTRSTSSRPHTAGKALAVALAFCLGSTATYFATAPSALAATVVIGIDGPGWMARLHGHTHAELHAHFDQVLAGAGVDDARKQQVAAIVSAAMQAEHADMRRYHATWGTLEKLLAAPRIDEGAVEKLRAEQDALFVDTSRRLSETAVQIARTLTPAQRQALSAEIDRRMASGHHAHD